MTYLNAWAARWGVPDAALADLTGSLIALGAAPPAPGATTESEAAVQARVRVAASRLGMRLWRNNVGVYHDPETGAYVRFGLANDSKQLNAVVKSADLIGIRPRVVLAQDVGTVIGQFVSYECKHGGWRWTGSEREKAQQAWAMLVTSLGGEAKFLTSAGGVS